MLNYLKESTNYTTTENGALTHKTSNSHVLDLYSSIGALRGRSERDIINLFEKSFIENPLLTMKVLFYARGIRNNGIGERNTFRVIVKSLANTQTDIMRKNIELIPVFGRWDDVYALFGTKLEQDAIALFKAQLQLDVESDSPSLCAKWLKSENTSSKESRELARKTAKGIGVTPRQYRKLLSELRKRIGILETKITTGEYGAIDYSKIPSKAGLVYRSAFYKNDEERYQAFLEGITKGEVKVNSKTLLPYEIVSKLMSNGYFTNYVSDQDKMLYNAMWKNLPDYIGDGKEDCLAVIDTSGSMRGLPVQIAVSLGIYLAEKNKGAFANHYITFSDQPRLVELIGDDLSTKMSHMEQIHPYNTDINATFDLILNLAISKNLSQNELPTRIVIISDMEFDSADGGMTRDRKPVKKATFDIIKKKFEDAGYTMPNLVFWKVDSRQDNCPMTMNDKGVQLVSGSSPYVFDTLLANKYVGAYELMLKELDKDVYSAIRV